MPSGGYAELAGQVGKVFCDVVMLRVRLRARRRFVAPFEWAVNESGLEATLPGGVEVEVVTSHHAAFSRIELQEPGTGQIRLG